MPLLAKRLLRIYVPFARALWLGAAARREPTVEYGMAKASVPGPFLKTYAAVKLRFDPTCPCGAGHNRVQARSGAQALGEFRLCLGGKSTAHLRDIFEHSVPYRRHEHAADAVWSKPVADDHARQDLPRLDLLPDR